MSVDCLIRSLSKKRISEVSNMLSPLGEIYSRSQFGGYGLCCQEAMFALVADGELYLRSSKELIGHFEKQKMERFVYEKRGMPISMEYYKVDEILWQNHDELLDLARKALIGAKSDREKIHRHRANRIKELPNLNVNIEKDLWRAGITTVDALKQLGAKTVYRMLSETKTHLGLKLLFALEGAIQGYHVAALPDDRKRELQVWWDSQARYQKEY